MDKMDLKNTRVLLVDDNPVNLDVLVETLEQEGYDILIATNGMQALSVAQQRLPDLILLDINMPEMDGYEVCRRLKEDDRTRAIPILFISALGEMLDKVRAFEGGGVDYITKPFQTEEVLARIRTHLTLRQLQEDLQAANLGLKEKNEALENTLNQVKEMQNQLIMREKLASLGKLSAGMAHELNNPVAATQRGAGQLETAFSQLQDAHRKMGELRLSDTQLSELLVLDQQAQERARQRADLDALVRSDKECEMETWLKDWGIQNAWEHAPTLVNLDYDPNELQALADHFTVDQFPVVIAWFGYTYTIYSLLSQIGLGTSRMAEIVQALKAYTYMDQAPVQSVDTHEALDNTLVILHNKLKAGVTVCREYCEDLPLIQAYGSELNQVWTNLIDNAIDAMGGKGALILRTFKEASWVVVEIEDDGPGIPEDIQSKLFDPFFTTKPPGEGTGLGLSISHNIVVQKHGGKITVSSQPGKTCFSVRLPTHFEPAESS